MLTIVLAGTTVRLATGTGLLQLMAILRGGRTLQDGILKAADQNARNTISSMLQGLGSNEVVQNRADHRLAPLT